MLDRAIRWSLKKVAPKSIPLSGPRALENDFYATYIIVDDMNWKMLVSELSPRGYTGLLWEDEKNGRDATLLIDELKESRPRIVIEHYFHGYQFDYKSPIKFLISQLVSWHRIRIQLDYFSQQAFNRKQLVRKERLELLKLLVEKSIEEPGKTFDPLFLGMEFHSRRWFYHPQMKENHAHLKMVMDSLVETGDLKKTDSLYKVSPRALITLSDYACEEQRHQDNLNTFSVGNKLTRAIILVGIAGIVTQLFIWWSGPRG